MSGECNDESNREVVNILAERGLGSAWYSSSFISLSCQLHVVRHQTCELRMNRLIWNAGLLFTVLKADAVAFSIFPALEWEQRCVCLFCPRVLLPEVDFTGFNLVTVFFFPDQSLPGWGTTIRWQHWVRSKREMASGLCPKAGSSGQKTWLCHFFR